MPGILVIDDDPLHLDLIVDSLSSLDYEVHTSKRAQQGITMARSIRPELIFMDISLPELDGITAIEMIRQDDILADVPIIAITATRTNEMLRRLEVAGVNGVITKPFQLSVLREQARDFLST